jgi:hypothetical protein
MQISDENTLICKIIPEPDPEGVPMCVTGEVPQHYKKGLTTKLLIC